MAVDLTAAQLAAALRLGDTAEETAEATRLLAYATEAITRHLGDAYAGTPAVVVNEAAIRLAGYLYDQPNAGRGDRHANALRNSGAGRMLLPYALHGAGGDAEVAAAVEMAGTEGNPVVGIEVQDTALVVTYQDGTVARLDLPDVAEASDARNRQIDRRIASWARENNPAGTIPLDRFADDSIPATKLADDAVTGRKLAAGAVASGHIADGAVEGRHVGTGEIVARHIAADTITGAEIAGGAVGTDELADAAVSRAKLSPAVVALLDAMGGGSVSRWDSRTTYDPGDIVYVTTTAWIAVALNTAVPPVAGATQWRELTAQPLFRAFLPTITPASVEQSIAGEKAGDLVLGYTATEVAILRYVAAPTNAWQVVTKWARAGRTDAELEAFVERIVATWAIAGNADGIPGSKTYAGLFRSEQETPIPAANVVVQFDVGTNADANEVDETDAAATTFAITEEQANEVGGFLRVRYNLSRTAAEGPLPRDIELLLQDPTTGATITKHNLKDEGTGTAQFAFGDAGRKRWAVRCVTKGRYAGNLSITGTTYHAAAPLADGAIQHVVEPIVSAEAEKRQQQDEVLQADIARVEGIKAIVNGLPSATAQRKGAIVWKDNPAYEQADSDRFQVPATGFVQFILGNLGATPIMRAEDCRNREMTGIYTFGRDNVGLEFDAAGNARLVANRAGTRSPLANDIGATTVGYVMLTWAPARASGHATTELADLEERVEELEEGAGQPRWRLVGEATIRPNNTAGQAINLVTQSQAGNAGYAFPDVYANYAALKAAIDAGEIAQVAMRVVETDASGADTDEETYIKPMHPWFSTAARVRVYPGFEPGEQPNEIKLVFGSAGITVTPDFVYTASGGVNARIGVRLAVWA